MFFMPLAQLFAPFFFECSKGTIVISVEYYNNGKLLKLFQFVNNFKNLSSWVMYTNTVFLLGSCVECH